MRSALRVYGIKVTCRAKSTTLDRMPFPGILERLIISDGYSIPRLVIKISRVANQSARGQYGRAVSSGSGFDLDALGRK